MWSTVSIVIVMSKVSITEGRFSFAWVLELFVSYGVKQFVVSQWFGGLIVVLVLLLFSVVVLIFFFFFLTSSDAVETVLLSPKLSKKISQKILLYLFGKEPSGFQTSKQVTRFFSSSDEHQSKPHVNKISLVIASVYIDSALAAERWDKCTFYSHAKNSKTIWSFMKLREELRTFLGGVQLRT